MENFFKFIDRLSTSQSIVPAMILFVLLFLAVIVLVKAQRRPDFDIADMLRDDYGKISSTRVFAFISLAVSSWIVSFLTISDKLTADYYLYYLVTWSGATVIMKALDKWNGTSPIVTATPMPPAPPAPAVLVQQAAPPNP